MTTPNNESDEPDRKWHRCDGCGNQVDRFGLTRSEATLIEDNQVMRRQIHDIRISPAPEMLDDPGYTIWRALMEDLRAEGEVRMSVRTVNLVEIGYEPVPEVVPNA